MITMDTEEHVEHGTPAETLQLQYAAMRVSFTWWGTRKALTDDQKEEAATNFDADKGYLSASKKLIDTKHPAYKPLAKVKRSIVSYWKMKTLPFPEPGIRLLPQAKLEEFEAFMQNARSELAEAVAGLQESYSQIRRKAEHDLGRLFNEDDYPSDVSDLFSVCWNVESVTPPDWLLELKPQWYEREMQRVRSLFNNAVELAEQAFIKEMSDLVTTLRDRLTDNADGTPNVFGDGCVEKLKAFISRFQELSVKSNDDLERLVSECDSLTHGVTADHFRGLPELRQHVAAKLAEVQAAMEPHIQALPRRKIIRRPAATE
jgi:hypothetical protein